MYAHDLHVHGQIGDVMTSPRTVRLRRAFTRQTEDQTREWTDRCYPRQHGFSETLAAPGLRVFAVFAKMELERRRRLAAMAAALSEMDEAESFCPTKRSCLQKEWISRKELEVPNQLYAKLLDFDPTGGCFA